MTWEQIVLIIILVWALALTYVCFGFHKRLARLEKQPPKHTHPGEEILFTTKVKSE
jgi:hypothetical protein